MLEPLLRDLKCLEDDGIFVPSMGKVVKGTVFSVVADNLGAHSIGGFVENFSSSHFCHFCIRDSSQIQEHDVREGMFPLRTKSNHTEHVKAALSDTSKAHHFGVKKDSVPSLTNLVTFMPHQVIPPTLCMICLRGSCLWNWHCVSMCL